MKTILPALLVITLACTACHSNRVSTKAEEYRKNGTARDMSEALRMAENYYWQDNAKAKDDERRRQNEERAKTELAKK